MGRVLRQLIAGHEQRFVGLCATGEGDPSLNLIASGYKFYPLWEQLSIPRLVRQRKIPTFLAPFNTAPLRLPREVRLVVIVHDLIFMDPLPPSRSLYQNFGRMYRRLVVPSAIQKADLIITMTDYTARQVVSRFNFDKTRIRTIPASIGDEWLQNFAASSPRAPYILLVAGEAPSKNLSRAIAAFARCRSLRKDAQLEMVVGGVKEQFHARFRNEAQQLGVGGRITFLRYISEAEMRDFYRGATLFMMPSLAEGFGIPVVEAMASGAPVIASAGTCLEEVGGDAALYFDPLSVEDMAQTMCKVLDSPSLRESMAIRGRSHVKQFSEESVGTQISALWQEILG